MPLDGVTLSCVAHELQTLVGGRVDKITMPERDEVVLAVRSHGEHYRLLLTANPSQPRVHFTKKTKENPMQPPLFCMVLRKHLGGGKIVGIFQPDFERILELHIESFDEMGDVSTKRLIVEIMGKHSNIILVGPNGILDAARRVSREISSVREVLPGGAYMRPPSQDKKNPLLLGPDFFTTVNASKDIVQTMLYTSYSGISPVMAGEICERAGVPADTHCETLQDNDVKRLYDAFATLCADIENGRYSPAIVLNGQHAPVEFSAMPLTCYGNSQTVAFDQISELLEYYYAEKDRRWRMDQKTADLRKLVRLALERAARKKDLHVKTLREVHDRDTFKLWGELLTANIYALEPGMTSFTTENFYDGSEITIRLDPMLTPVENAQWYFGRYNKQKRTYAAVCEQMQQTDEELAYLESVLTLLGSCVDMADVEEVREELAEQGFIKKRKARRSERKSKPLMVRSSDGFEIYIGKNNRQNDELTLHFAQNADLWFHTKEIPGSHVIVRTNGQTPPDQTLTEAANLAAYYSKARNGSHVPVDYTLRRNVKKPSGAKPGMVIYDNYKTAFATPMPADSQGMPAPANS